MSPRPDPFRFDVLLEDHAEIRAKDLKARGVFDSEDLRSFVFDVGGRSVDIKYAPNSESIVVLIRHGRTVLEQAFQVKCVQNNFGQRYFFRCNHTGRPVSTLYLEGGRLRSRHVLQRPYTSRAGRPEREQLEARRLCARLAGVDGRGPAREPGKSRIVTRLLELQDRGAYLTKAASVIMARHLVTPSKPPSKRRAAPEKVSTKAAAVRQRRKLYVSPSTIIAGALDLVQVTRKRVPASPRGKTLDAANDFVDRHPRLALGELTRMMPPDPEHLWAEAFLWDVDGVPLWCTVCVDRKPGRWFAVVRFSFGDDAEVQVVEIVHGAQRNPKPYFLCPVSGARTETLYFRGGRFASAAAQRLIHRSQRARPSLWRPDSLR